MNKEQKVILWLYCGAALMFITGNTGTGESVGAVLILLWAYHGIFHMDLFK